VTQSKALYKRLITVEITVFEILEKLAALSYHDEKTAAGMKILLMDLHVLRELTDTRSEDGHLYLCGTCVCPVYFEFFDQLLFFSPCRSYRSLLSEPVTLDIPQTQANVALRRSV